MIGVSAKNSRYLDKKECFEMYVKLGSLAAVKRYFDNKGFVNPATGFPPTRQAIKNATFTYILFNIPEAKKTLDDYYLSKGVEWNDEKFHEMLIIYGARHLTRSTYFHIMKEQGLYEKAVEYLDGLA
jgi:hypothetical protein